MGNSLNGANGHAKPMKDLNDQLRLHGNTSVADGYYDRQPFDFNESPGQANRDEFHGFDHSSVPVTEPIHELVTIDPREWQGKIVPARDWIVPGLVPAGKVTLFSGDGGSGKSLLMVQLAISRCISALWLGLEPKRGRTLYLSAEDDKDELHRRTDAICRHYGCRFEDLGDFIPLDLVGQDAVLGAQSRQSGKIEATPVYEALRLCAQTMQPDLVILDSLPDVFAGLENDRQQARQFIGLLTRLCRETGQASDEREGAARVVTAQHHHLLGFERAFGVDGQDLLIGAEF